MGAEPSDCLSLLPDCGLGVTDSANRAGQALPSVAAMSGACTAMGRARGDPASHNPGDTVHTVFSVYPGPDYAQQSLASARHMPSTLRVGVATHVPRHSPVSPGGPSHP